MSERVLVLATRNRHKVEELMELFDDLPLGRILCALDFPDVPDVIEDGDTLEANALKKAREVAEATGHMCLADDTGLFVDALDGAPGVFAARYAGEGCSYADNCRKLVAELDELGPSVSRDARFRTVMAVVDPAAPGGPKALLAEGELAGEILHEARGSGGFGYDPLFHLPDRGATLAEMELEEKNRISHRARAAKQMHEVLFEYLAGIA